MAVLTSQAVSPTQRRGVYITVALILALILIMLAGFIHKLKSPRVLSAEELRINGLYILDTPRQLSAFTLQDQHGQDFGIEQLQGKWSLVFFGFTHCPDICPSTLSLLNKLTRQLQPDILAQTQVVFVSADPARDTAAKLAEYMPFFNPDFIGISGDFLMTKRLGNQLNVPFVKVPQVQGYTIDHGGQVVIVNPRGDYHGFFSTPLDLARVKLTYQSMVSTSNCCGQ